ncbi:hypothetical protein LCGC14_2275160 [marine sediment metagenome]|uniref:Uncharacterized protein n=1 Tax=marine sediment metagenome TaxID=412755 RepID=A0A0F9FQX8_9ZZZZ
MINIVDFILVGIVGTICLWIPFLVGLFVSELINDRLPRLWHKASYSVLMALLILYVIKIMPTGMPSFFPPENLTTFASIACSIILIGLMATPLLNCISSLDSFLDKKGNQ